MRKAIACLFLFAASAFGANEYIVRNTCEFTHPTPGMTVVGGELELPSGGYWEIVQPPPESGLQAVNLIAPEELRQARFGKTAAAGERQRNVNRGRYSVQQFQYALREYAKKHDGIAPASFDELGEPHKYIIERAKRSPWSEDRQSDQKGPFYFLIPSVPMPLDPKTGVLTPGEEAKPLVLELRPYIGDGKHWVLFTDGRARRVEIDQELVKKYRLTISAVLPAVIPIVQPQTYRHRIVALRLEHAPGAILIRVRDFAAGAELSCRWEYRGAGTADAKLLADWAQARALSWQPLLEGADAPILRAWLNSYAKLYGIKMPGANDRQRDRDTSMFNVLGGRTAVRETLQLQALTRDAKAGGAQDIPIDKIPGVEVKSHPFDEMLAGRDGGRLPLADAVPLDRFFVYFAKPSVLLNFMGGGSKFIWRSVGAMTGNAVEYDLQGRYFSRLGITKDWARLFLQSGMAREVGIVLPDLFLTDGTDVTVLVRVENLNLGRTLLGVLGITGLTDGRTLTLPLPDGGKAYWTLRGDLLLISAHEQELVRIIELQKAKGRGSLGQSAEFRYMLLQLPVEKTTTAYCYFSDPFIRRLVGPQVKLGQLRRLRAMVDLTTITAGALLYKADGRTGTPTLSKLAELEYVPARLAEGEYSLHEDLAAESKTYGTLARPSSLLNHPVTAVTRAEEQAYKSYLTGYNQFWRRFFDPIAMRLDETGEGQYEFTTFILPLIDNRVYGSVREMISSKESDNALRIPNLSPEPVLLFSVNLTRKAWTEAAGNMSRELLRYVPIDPEIFDYMRPCIHLAIQDSDPVLAFGSGNLFGAFGGRMPWGSKEMFFIPVALSALTRPSKLLVELEDVGKVEAILNRAVTRRVPAGRSREFGASFAKTDGLKAWRCNLNFFGMINLRLGIEIRGNFLVISNVPWSQSTEVTSVAEAPLKSGRLAVSPGRAERQLAALHAANVDSEAGVALQGMAYLHPLLLSRTAATPGEASALHARLLGFRPVHPGDGQWTWQDGRIESTVFGSPTRQKRPQYKPGDRDFGLLRAVDHVTLNMQFEDDGLRATCGWKLRKKERP